MGAVAANDRVRYHVFKFPSICRQSVAAQFSRPSDDRAGDHSRRRTRLRHCFMSPPMRLPAPATAVVVAPRASPSHATYTSLASSWAASSLENSPPRKVVVTLPKLADLLASSKCLSVCLGWPGCGLMGCPFFFFFFFFGVPYTLSTLSTLSFLELHTSQPPSPQIHLSKIYLASIN